MRLVIELLNLHPTSTSESFTKQLHRKKTGVVLQRTNSFCRRLKVQESKSTSFHALDQWINLWSQITSERITQIPSLFVIWKIHKHCHHLSSISEHWCKVQNKNLDSIVCKYILHNVSLVENGIGHLLQVPNKHSKSISSSCAQSGSFLHATKLTMKNTRSYSRWTPLMSWISLGYPKHSNQLRNHPSGNNHISHRKGRGFPHLFQLPLKEYLLSFPGGYSNSWMLSIQKKDHSLGHRKSTTSSTTSSTNAVLLSFSQRWAF